MSIIQFAREKISGLIRITFNGLLIVFHPLYLYLIYFTPTNYQQSIVSVQQSFLDILLSLLRAVSCVSYCSDHHGAPGASTDGAE